MSGFLSVCEDKIRLISHYNMNATPHGPQTGDAHLLGQRGHFAPDNNGKRSSVESGVLQHSQGRRCTVCWALVVCSIHPIRRSHCQAVYMEWGTTTLSDNHDSRCGSDDPNGLVTQGAPRMTHHRGRAAVKLLERQPQSYSFIQIHIKFTWV